MAISPIQIGILLLPLIFITAAARPGVQFHPCKTLFVSYTLATSDLSENPNSDANPSRFYAVYRIIRPVRFYTSDPSSISLSVPRPIRAERSSASADQMMPYFGVTNSLRERAKDILVVVVGLLFGVGCGALTAATMYLAWSLLNNRYDVCGSGRYEYDDEDYEEYDEIESPKKMGYASVQIVPATPASPVKEGN